MVSPTSISIDRAGHPLAIFTKVGDEMILQHYMGGVKRWLME